MRQLGLLFAGIILISAAVGAFAYRQLSSWDPGGVREAGGQGGSARTVLMRGSEISYPIGVREQDRSSAAKGSGRLGASIEMFNFIFNLLNVIVGFIGVFFAAMSLRSVQPHGPAGGTDIARAT